jgi:hypothetical protein
VSYFSSKELPKGKGIVNLKYMKKLLISLVLLFSLITPVKDAQALDPKAKAFMIMTAYGTVGGALLGFATLAFGNNSRAIAQGASLGLYAGIAFGAYVINTHHTRNNPVSNEPVYDPYAPPARDPYAPRDPYNQNPYGTPPPPPQPSGGGFGAPPPEDGGFFGGRVEEINHKLERNFQAIGTHGNTLSRVPIYFNLYNSTF